MSWIKTQKGELLNLDNVSRIYTKEASRMLSVKDFNGGMIPTKNKDKGGLYYNVGDDMTLLPVYGKGIIIDCPYDKENEGYCLYSSDIVLKKITLYAQVSPFKESDLKEDCSPVNNVEIFSVNAPTKTFGDNKENKVEYFNKAEYDKAMAIISHITDTLEITAGIKPKMDFSSMAQSK